MPARVFFLLEYECQAVCFLLEGDSTRSLLGLRLDCYEIRHSTTSILESISDLSNQLSPPFLFRGLEASR